MSLKTIKKTCVRNRTTLTWWCSQRSSSSSLLSWLWCSNLWWWWWLINFCLVKTTYWASAKCLVVQFSGSEVSMQWSGHTLRHPPLLWRCWLWQWLMMVAEMFMMFVTFSPQKMLALSNTRHSTLCSLLHCSSANGYIDDAHLQMLICKWKW